jgi:hypothetical protein
MILWRNGSMKSAALVLALAALPLLGLASCAGPQPPLTPAAAFALRSTEHPPRKKVQDAAEAWIAVKLLHPSSVTFTAEFQSNAAHSVAICGWLKYRDRKGAYTPFRPYYVEFTSNGTMGSNQPFVPDDRLAALCGNITANPPL